MRIDITHIGQDYAKVEVKRYVQKKTIEFEVPLAVGIEIRNILRACERIITSQAYSAHEIKN